MSGDTPANRGLTLREVAALLRIGRDRVRGWVRSGVLPAVNAGTPGRPRYVVLATDLEKFLAGRRVAPAPKPVRRVRKRICGVDYYPD
jgi:excisionase family DNA binding protein